jgi:uncharacterized protein (TIGR02265 family)
MLEPEAPFTLVSRIDRPPIPDSEKLLLYPAADHLTAARPLLSAAAELEIRTHYRAYLDAPQHPALLAMEIVDRICTLALAHLPLAQARQVYGRAVLRQWRYTIVGRVMTGALPFLGMQRIVAGLPRYAASVTNYGSRWVSMRTPHYWQYEALDEVIYPEMFAGLLEGLSDLVHVRDLQVTYRRQQPYHHVFTLRWARG